MKKRVLLITICGLLLSSVVAFAQIRLYHNIGFGNSAKNLVVWKDASVSTYGYNLFTDNGMSGWKNISSNLDFTVSTASTPPTYFSVPIYVGQTIPGWDVTGVVDYHTYQFWGWSEVTEDAYRDRARIRMDHTNLQRAQYSQRQYIFTHEFGHAFGLFHNNGAGVASVMRDHTVNFSHNTPQAADRATIRAKYGN
ncbi:hypothetical protein [Paenibacillus daejeonensis]|uniref:hypothetical protein n=1 Tax=Paenibacillus daejeonensis TaxID=135193 RepID=UPI0012FBCACA|nr:hypothetical protein [Paenibacillus daejeonensis]